MATIGQKWTLTKIALVISGLLLLFTRRRRSDT